MAVKNSLVPALQPRSALYQAPQQQQADQPNFCKEISRVSEDEAWALLMLLAANGVQRGNSSSEICAELQQAEACREWTHRRPEVIQLLARHGCRPSSTPTGRPTVTVHLRPPAGTAGFVPRPTPTPGGSTPGGSTPGGCGCPKPNTPPQSNFPMNSQTPAQDWTSGCGAFRKPDPSAQGVAFANSCAEAACRGGSRIGLEQIPWERTLAPGATEVITIGYTRNARLVGLTFNRRRTPGRSYNVDNWSLRKWRTDKANQPYDFTRRGTTFNGDDPNDIWVPAAQYYEDGDASVSPILHGMNPIPSMIPPNNIGNNDGLVEFEVELAAAAPGPETAFGFLLVLFLQGS